jgi:hypothetical protein
MAGLPLLTYLVVNADVVDVPGCMKVLAGALIGAMVRGWAIWREGRDLRRLRNAQTLHLPELKSPTDLGAAS